MNFSEIVRAVADRTQLSVEESADLVRAVAQTLGQRLSAGEVAQLARELPDGLAAELTRVKHGAVFGLDELLERVRAHTGLNAEETRMGVQATLSVLREAVSAKEYADVLSQLPREISELAQPT
jgi:uncharacterized protein (DUF2267 family)